VIIRELNTVHLVIKPFETICNIPVTGQPEPGTWEDTTCFDCLEGYIDYLERYKKRCCQYVSGDSVKLADPDILESLNEKIENIFNHLVKLDR